MHGAVFDFGAFHRNKFHHRSVELVFVALGGGAAFQVTYIAAVFRNDQGAFKLAGVAFVDAEVGGEFHRAMHAFGDEHEGAISEHRAVQRRKKVIGHRHHAAEILLHQFGVGMDGFGDGAENHARLLQFGFKGGGNADAIEHGIHRDFALLDARQDFLFGQWDAEFLVGFEDFGVEVFQRLRAVFLAFGRGVVGDGLVVNFWKVRLLPMRHRHFLPLAEGFEAPFQQPCGFVLAGTDRVDGLFIQPRR